ncbi:hypothetical protein TGAM01_v202052, partial [Trichoderma gamsii]
PPEANHHDNDGHGTHVAYLLLRLAKHADLRICKVTNSRCILDVDIQRIAEAIIHSSQKGDPRSEDHVDILTLSFCFPRYDDVLRPIYHAILKAQANGVIIFAASGNECGDAGLSWPVSLYEMGNVIQISSSDGKGPPSGYNLRLDIGRWICTLGQGVPSCQLQLGTEYPIYRSGSSLATPIAAAIAAIILGIVDHAYSVLFPQDMIVLWSQLRTRLGMEKILCETCTEVGHRSSSSPIAPWFFFQHTEVIQMQRIRNILSNIRDQEKAYICQLYIYVLEMVA